MEEIKLPIELKSSPIVFAVGHEYHIMALTRADVIFRVTVNGKHYYDADNGLMRSNTPVHKVVVPMAELDAAKEYGAGGGTVIHARGTANTEVEKKFEILDLVHSVVNPNGIAASLSAIGRTVLCIDMDIGLRNLDLSLGMSDRALMDFSDVAQNRCSLESAVVEHPRIPNLFLRRLLQPYRLRRLL